MTTMLAVKAQAPRPGTQTRVAVVIACYDAGATLRQALDSLREQEACEIVVVDDGSADPETLALLHELRGKGVRVVRQRNQGPSAARMTGVRETTSRYVTAADADDAQAPGALAKLADALDADSALALVWGDTETFGALRSRRELASTLDPWLITYVNDVPAGAMMRREALLETGGWQLRGGYEDWDLWMSFAERGLKGRRLPFLNGYYRVGGEGGVQARAVQRHEQLVAELRRRHTRLFDERATNRRASDAPLRAKLLLPLVDRLPLSEHSKHRLAQLVCNPIRLLLTRLPRPRAAAPIKDQ